MAVVSIGQALVAAVVLVVVLETWLRNAHLQFEGGGVDSWHISMHMAFTCLTLHVRRHYTSRWYKEGRKYRKGKEKIGMQGKREVKAREA